MPWHRNRIGNVREGGLVHVLYEWHKFERVHWDTQCGIEWEHRNNTNVMLKPPTSKKSVTCLACIAYQLRLGAAW